MIITKHDLINIKVLLTKQRLDLENAIRFSEEHPKLANRFCDGLEQMKVYLELCQRALNTISTILDKFDESDEFVLTGKEN